MKFTEFGFEDSLLEGLQAMGFEEATPVQEQAIPLIMEGNDVLACAQTGTGKTAAFLLPMLNRLANADTGKTHTIIIEPTRELVMQVDQQLEALSYFLPISSIAVYGGRDGHAMEQEKRAFKGGVSVIVATPGRFTSHIEMGYVDMASVQCLILDEADRMLDMGFAPAIMNIVNKLPTDRQTLLFSATMPNDIRRFAKQLQKDPKEINIAVSKPAENIIQGVYEVEEEGKVQLAVRLLSNKKNLNRIIIFASTKKMVRELDKSLQRAGLNATSIHSDLEQKEREERLLGFKNGSIPIVVATDVLSRGIDISGIDLVINFDCPNDAEDYVHRIGRTARAEASGIALTFINGKDFRKFLRIEETADFKVRRLALPPDLADFKSKPGRGGGGGFRGRGGGGRGKYGKKKKSGGYRDKRR